MLFWEVTALYSESHLKHIDKLVVQIGLCVLKYVVT
jgi:hypothetical protein